MTQPNDLVNITIDDVEIAVPKGTLVIRAAEILGVQVPRFCDHPLLDPGRLPAVPGRGGGPAQADAQASCTTGVRGMVVRTQQTSRIRGQGPAAAMELLLINHPLDCPVCDKGGECPCRTRQCRPHRNPLHRRQAHLPKPINLSSVGAPAGP